MDCDPQEFVPSKFPMGTQETKEEDEIKKEGRLFDSPCASDCVWVKTQISPLNQELMCQ